MPRMSSNQTLEQVDWDAIRLPEFIRWLMELKEQFMSSRDVVECSHCDLCTNSLLLISESKWEEEMGKDQSEMDDQT
jgi:hypothetical protein